MSDNMWNRAYSTWAGIDENALEDDDSRIQVGILEALLAIGQELSGIRDDLRKAQVIVRDAS